MKKHDKNSIDKTIETTTGIKEGTAGKENFKIIPDPSIDVHKSQDLGYRMESFDDGDVEMFIIRDGYRIGDLYINNRGDKTSLEGIHIYKQFDSNVNKMSYNLLEAAITEYGKKGIEVYSDQDFLSRSDEKLWRKLVDNGLAEYIGEIKPDKQYIEDMGAR